jgi:hypothetical protein
LGWPRWHRGGSITRVFTPLLLADMLQRAMQPAMPISAL